MMKNKYAILTMLAAGLALTPLAGAQRWSTLGSTCQPGSDSLFYYSNGSSGSAFEFYPGIVGTIKARCQVYNPLDKGVPTWNTLGAGFIDGDGHGGNAEVQVRLVRSYKGSGKANIIATLDSDSYTTDKPTFKTVPFTHTFDFVNYDYFVTIELNRTDDTIDVGVWNATIK